MRCARVLLTVVLAAALLPGCIMACSREVVKEKACEAPDGAATGMHVRLGDAAMVEGNPEEAIENYERAVKFDGSLAGNEDFQKKVARARAMVAYNKGRREADSGRWPAAVVQLIESAGYGPTFQPARDLLALARKQAAGEHVARAGQMIAEAKSEKSEALALAVMAELRKALGYDPDCAEAQLMLNRILSSLGAAPPAAAP